jgi:hypothetical protein
MQSRSREPREAADGRTSVAYRLPLSGASWYAHMLREAGSISCGVCVLALLRWIWDMLDLA